MKSGIAIVMLIGLSACTTLYGAPKSLDEIHSAPDWRMDDGDKLAAAYQRDVSRWAKGRPVEALRSELVAGGFECAEGGMVCTRMFATRACQTDWRIELAVTTGGKPKATFERDCVGTGGDWPEPKNSAIDDQLAPPPPVM